MKYFLICLAIFFSFATAQAKLTGEVIFAPPIDAFNEFWVTDVEKARDDRPFFKMGRSPEGLAV